MNTATCRPGPTGQIANRSGTITYKLPIGGYVSISTSPGVYNFAHKDPKRRSLRGIYLFYLRDEIKVCWRSVKYGVGYFI